MVAHIGREAADVAGGVNDRARPVGEKPFVHGIAIEQVEILSRGREHNRMVVRCSEVGHHRRAEQSGAAGNQHRGGHGVLMAPLSLYVHSPPRATMPRPARAGYT